MIPAPRNILVSYHYFKGFDLNKFAGLRVIGDSGAFSAKHQGAEITTPQLAAWAQRWRHRLCWVAALDVIGNPVATQRNWHEMVDTHGVPAVPTVHFGGKPELLDYYVQRGVDFIGLGGMVGRPIPAQMRWLVSMFRYARDHHPDLRFHGWGVTSADALKLPFYSVDSSGWGGGYRYGRLSLRDPASAKVHSLELNGRTTYAPEVARLLSRHYGVAPSEVATSGPHNRLLMVRLSALSASVQEQQFRRMHRRNPVPAPHWGQLDGANASGPHAHLALNNKGQDYEVDTVTALAAPDGPHMHLAGTGQCRDLAVAGPHLHSVVSYGAERRVAEELADGPHIHLAEGSAEHLEIVARMNTEEAP